MKRGTTMNKMIFTSALLLFIPVSVKALDLSSEHIVLYNMNEDKIIYELDKDEKTSVASLTKIMTTLVAVENIEDYDEKIVIHDSMFEGLKEANAAVIGLKDGQVVTYNDLLYGMFLSSGADATRAIAISISEDENSFVMLMNQKAEELGMTNTHFVNTTGLDEDNQYSTANDIATLLKEALKNEKFREIFMTESYIFTDKSLIAYSTVRKTAKNYGYEINYIEGAKTGYTYAAGKCLASVAFDQENNIQYLLVTTNASTYTNDAYHIKDAVTIYNYYFDNYKYHTLVNKGDLVLTLPVKYSKEENINIYALDDITHYLDNNFSKEDVVLNYVGTTLVTPTMKKGSKLGIIEVIYNDEILDTFDVYLPYKVKFSLFLFLKEKISYVISAFLIMIILLLNIIKRKKIETN